MLEKDSSSPGPKCFWATDIQVEYTHEKTQISLTILHMATVVAVHRVLIAEPRDASVRYGKKENVTKFDIFTLKRQHSRFRASHKYKTIPSTTPSNLINPVKGLYQPPSAKKGGSTDTGAGMRYDILMTHYITFAQTHLSSWPSLVSTHDKLPYLLSSAIRRVTSPVLMRL